MPTTPAVYGLPSKGFVRLSQIVGNRRADPPIAGAIPISPSQWWEWVKTRKAPAPIKLGPATTVWKAEEIHELIERLGSGEADAPASRETAGTREPSERAAALVRAKRAKRDRQAA